MLNITTKIQPEMHHCTKSLYLRMLTLLINATFNVEKFDTMLSRSDVGVPKRLKSFRVSDKQFRAKFAGMFPFLFALGKSLSNRLDVVGLGGEAKIF